jgi:hypothetical protein
MINPFSNRMQLKEKLTDSELDAIVFRFQSGRLSLNFRSQRFRFIRNNYGMIYTLQTENGLALHDVAYFSSSAMGSLFSDQVLDFKDSA